MIATRTLAVPGATLHYEVTGTGPVLLISPSGHNGSRQGVDLARHLADAYTVVTYDRRGLARSSVGDPRRPVTMAAHTDDAHRLLAAVTDEPAFMLGCSFGAVIGLRLAAEHPERLATLVAHEPVAPALLPGAERARHEEELDVLRRLLREKGMAAALAEIARVLGIDPARETEPGLTPHPMTPERAADFRYFVEHDFGAVLADTFDPRAALETGVRVVPAVGRTTPGTVFDRRCAEELAKALGAEPAEFPGGHNGDLSHPRAYAARLREVLETSRTTV
ncbi:alpha/beta fold hydrolase [Actinoallomurus acaciae]|uniref:Alpha/beta fold hydrolase n=1 Tax=Actinoallomurus acaciae TaxID=502577 RepID=A0ABV5YF92_9ACTN